MNLDKKIFPGIYRALVRDNRDPKNKGRLKVYVPGVYPSEFGNSPDKLPFAEPAFPIFGGNYTSDESGSLNTETGISSVPHIGANIWVFFENLDTSFPVYFLNSQGGEGWLAEHIDQHVIKTNNVKIRVDENPAVNSSTSKFTTFNTNCTSISKNQVLDDVPTRVDVHIKASPNIVGALNLIIDGNVNMQINGNVYQEINGHKHETLVGNHYLHHVGDLHYVHEGDKLVEHTGNSREKQVGNLNKTRDGSEYEFISKNKSSMVNETSTLIVYGQRTETIQSTYSQTIIGNRSVAVIGAESKTVEGTFALLVEGAGVVNIASGTSGSGSMTVNSGDNINLTTNREVLINGRKIRLN